MNRYGIVGDSAKPRVSSRGMVPKPLPGLPGLIPGPLGAFAGLAAAADGSLYVAADEEGSVIRLRR